MGWSFIHPVKSIGSTTDLNASARTKIAPDIVSLITTALTALVGSAEVFPTIIKADLQACILHIFATVLATGACQESVVPAALPIFRRFTTSLTRNPQAETVEQLRTMLARLLAIVKKAQNRESEAALPAERNCLLAGTILLSSSARVLQPDDPLVRRYVDELAACLDNRMTTKVAAGLSRSLLLLPTATSPTSGPSATESQIAALLLGHFVAFLSHPSQVEGTADTRPLVAHGLTTFALAVPQKRRPTALALIVPTLLQRADEEGESVWSESCTRLLELARADGAAFRAVVGGLDDEKRILLQKVLVKGGAGAGGAGGGAGESRAQERGEPSIALKMDF